MSPSKTLRVLLVGPNASEKMGGEAILPLHWLRELRALGVEAELVTHARCRTEIMASSYADMPITFIEDSFLEKHIFLSTRNTSTAVRSLGLEITSVITNFRLGSAVRRAHRNKAFDLIHQVTPVAPKALNFSRITGIPFITGPMNGNMTYPASFEESHSAGTGRIKRLLASLTTLAHFFVSSKRKASLLLVANARTASGLPASVPAGKVRELVENGVDLKSWEIPAPIHPAIPTFIFVGRLVHWKAVDLLLHAFAALQSPALLEIIGDGAERKKLEVLAQELGIQDKVRFQGQIPQSEVRKRISTSTALVLPSVWECGGAVVLEAMACQKPAIATAWGGPCDYITEDTGFLVPPDSKEALIEGLGKAMQTLINAPETALAMGQNGRTRVETCFSWAAKADQMLEIYAGLTGTGKDS